MIQIEDSELTINNVNTIFESVLNHMGAYVYIKDVYGNYLYVNQLICDLFHCTPDDIIGKSDESFFTSSHLQGILDSDRRVIDKKQLVEIEESGYLISQQVLRVFKTVKAPIFGKDKQVIGLYGVSTDITALHKLKLKLENQANTDYLTKLANRRCFFYQADKAFSFSKRHGVPLSLLIADIDHFKKINDTFGHHAGDEVLKALSIFLSNNIRNEDTISRIGGEEFAFLLPGTPLDAAHLLADRLCEAVSKHLFNVGKSHINLTLSIGVTDLSNDDTKFHALFHRADDALYNAKNRGRNQVIAI